MVKDVRVRIADKTIIGGDDDCWRWTGGVRVDSRGVSRPAIQIGNRYRRVARVLLELRLGTLPAGQFACHSCDNPWCVNPQHLFPGSPRDNHDDMTSKGRGWWQRLGPQALSDVMRERQERQAKAGKIARGERCQAAKLNADIVRQIRLDRASHSQQEIAERFGVSQATVSRVLSGATWGHVR